MSSLLWQPQVSAYRRLAFGTEVKWVCVLMPIGHKWVWQSERPTSIQVCSSLCMCEWRNLWMRAHTVRGRSHSEFALVEQFVTLQIYPLIQTKMVTGMAFFYSNPGHTSEGQCRNLRRGPRLRETILPHILEALICDLGCLIIRPLCQTKV